MPRSSKVLYLLFGFLGISVIALFFYGLILQQDAYHHFADNRELFGGIPNTLNSISNIAFVYPAIFLLMRWFVRLSSDKGIKEVENILPVYIFALGMIGIGFGSALYHLFPSNETLIWDRLPMTICFAVIYAEFLCEYVSERMGRVSLWILLSFGVFSIIYWTAAGDLRPYVLVQFFPLLTIPIIAAIVGTEKKTFFFWLLYLIDPKHTSTILWRNTFLWYALAKFLEYADSGIYTLSMHMVSGHTLKHIASGIACGYALSAMQNRRN